MRPEMEHLWPKHWKEVAVNQDTVPLDVDFAAYDALDKAGMLHITVARENGRVVGYHILFVKPHLHYRSTLFAFSDVYYLDPAHRKGFAGVQLFRESERALRDRGVKVVVGNTKLSLDMSAIFKRLRWRETERVFVKYLGD